MPAPVTLTFDLLTLKVVSESHVLYVGYLCTNFSLPKPLCSRLRRDVRDRQMSDVRQHPRFNAPLFPQACRLIIGLFSIVYPSQVWGSETECRRVSKT